MRPPTPLSCPPCACSHTSVSGAEHLSCTTQHLSCTTQNVRNLHASTPIEHAAELRMLAAHTADTWHVSCTIQRMCSLHASTPTNVQVSCARSACWVAPRACRMAAAS